MEKRDLDYTDITEIDLSDKLNLIKKNWKVVSLITLFCFGIGLFHYIFAPDEYISTAVLIQETEAGGASIDGGGSDIIRSLTGISIQPGQGNLSAAARGRAPLPVSLYPLIVNSTDFQLELIHTEVEFSTLDSTITLFDYYSNFYTVPFRDRVYSTILDYSILLPRTIFSAVNRIRGNIVNLFKSSEASVNSGSSKSSPSRVLDSRLQGISSREMSVIDIMRTRLSVVIGGGVTEITTSLPDPYAAALINALLVDRIQEYMTDYRVEKAKQNLMDVTAQYEEAKERYEDSQMQLAKYLDANIVISTNVMRTHQEYLEDQRNLRFNIYNSMALEVEQARISLQQQIPVFNILEKPNIPTSPTSEASDLILVFSVIIGLFVGSGYVLIKKN